MGLANAAQNVVYVKTASNARIKQFISVMYEDS